LQKVSSLDGSEEVVLNGEFADGLSLRTLSPLHYFWFGTSLWRKKPHHLHSQTGKVAVEEGTAANIGQPGERFCHEEVVRNGDTSVVVEDVEESDETEDAVGVGVVGEGGLEGVDGFEGGVRKVLPAENFVE
jgi:hypothetical protein